MTSAPSTDRRRPRQVTFGATQAVVGGALATVLLITTAEQLYSSEMRDALAQALSDPRAEQLNLTIETARTIAKYTIMVMAVMSVASLVLGIFVLRRHAAARIALTALGVVVAGAALVAGPPGWAVTIYVVASLVMLWSKPARIWFADPLPPGLPPAPPPRG